MTDRGGPEPTADQLDRSRGALVGLATGDALGMPTQGLSFAVVRSRYGVLAGFEDAPDDNPISRGMTAGQVTDDTDQAVIVGRLLLAGAGRLDPIVLARDLLAWERRMRAAGSLDLLGPSTRRALDRVAEGVSPDESGRGGDTNGAAMRITPLGICCPLDTPDGRAGLERLVARVAEVSRVTHNTGLAIAGAAAVAAAVSAGIEGRDLRSSLDLAIEAAGIGAAYGEFAAGADVAARIRWAVDLVEGRSLPDALELVDRLVGTSVATQEAVPAALALASLMTDGDPWPIVCAAASVGGDSDTIAAMAGAVGGSHCGVRGFPEPVRAQLRAANPTLDLEGMADALCGVRLSR